MKLIGRVEDLELPDEVYGALSRLAAARGTTVTDVLHGQAILLSRTVIRNEEILDLYNRGMEVRDIARTLDITNTAVRAAMVALGLRSNRT